MRISTDLLAPQVPPAKTTGSFAIAMITNPCRESREREIPFPWVLESHLREGILPLLPGAHYHTSIRSMIPMLSRLHPAGPETRRSLPRLISWVSSYPLPRIPNPTPNRARQPGRVNTSPLAMVIFIPSPPAPGVGHDTRNRHFAVRPPDGRPSSRISLSGTGSSR